MGMPRGLLSGVAIIALDDDAHRAVSGADDQRVFRMDTGREQFGRKQQRNEHKHKACDQLEVTQGSHDDDYPATSFMHRAQEPYHAGSETPSITSAKCTDTSRRKLLKAELPDSPTR